MKTKFKQLTWDKILAHSAMVDNSLLCDAASNRANNLFSNSNQAGKAETTILINI